MSRTEDIKTILRLRGIAKWAYKRERKKLERNSTKFLRAEVVRLKELSLRAAREIAKPQMPGSPKYARSFNDSRTDRDEWAPERE